MELNEFISTEQLWEEMSAFDFGYDAYRQGMTRDQNPYLNHPTLIEAWNDGFDAAKGENVFH